MFLKEEESTKKSHLTLTGFKTLSELRNQIVNRTSKIVNRKSNMLTIQNLQKTYPNGVKALDNLNLEIKKGMFGLLGPNGAGKSSLMRTVATLQQPDSGSLHFGEIDILQTPMELPKDIGLSASKFWCLPKQLRRRIA
ncbi:MAG: ABC-type transport system involved in cytochrome bd biosynthesis fused ATPase/permease subunit [Flammeovirgaceae bacterium]